MAAKSEATERQSASAATASDDKLNQQISSIVEGLQAIGVQPNPDAGEPAGDDLHLGIAPDLDPEASERKAIYDRLVAIENKIKNRGSRGFGRYLFAILIGVAATMAWQSYGESAKQIIATRAPELGWSPKTRQIIATSIEWVGWTTRPSGGPEKQAPLAQTAPTNPSLDSGQLHQMTQSLVGLQQTIEKLAGGQDQIAREVRRVESAVAELNAKIPESPQPPVAPAPKPIPVPPSSRAPRQ
jgi:hypothetical protein